MTSRHAGTSRIIDEVQAYVFALASNTLLAFIVFHAIFGVIYFGANFVPNAASTLTTINTASLAGWLALIHMFAGFTLSAWLLVPTIAVLVLLRQLEGDEQRRRGLHFVRPGLFAVSIGTSVFGVIGHSISLPKDRENNTLLVCEVAMFVTFALLFAFDAWKRRAAERIATRSIEEYDLSWRISQRFWLTYALAIGTLTVSGFVIAIVGESEIHQFGLQEFGIALWQQFFTPLGDLWQALTGSMAPWAALPFLSQLIPIFLDRSQTFSGGDSRQSASIFRTVFSVVGLMMCFACASLSLVVPSGMAWPGVDGFIETLAKISGSLSLSIAFLALIIWRDSSGGNSKTLERVREEE